MSPSRTFSTPDILSEALDKTSSLYADKHAHHVPLLPSLSAPSEAAPARLNNSAAPRRTEEPVGSDHQEVDGGRHQAMGVVKLGKGAKRVGRLMVLMEFLLFMQADKHSASQFADWSDQSGGSP